MTYSIKVPDIRQSSDYTCWWASLRMVLAVREPGRALTGHPRALSKGWKRERKYLAEFERRRIRSPNSAHFMARKLYPKVGLNDRQFSELAEGNGLRPVPTRLGDRWTPQELEGLLRHYGPLWCAINRGGSGHVVVVCGIDSTDQVEVMDPERGRVLWHIDMFNGLLSPSPHALLYAPGPWDVQGPWESPW